MKESTSRALAAPQKPWWKAPLLYLSVGCFALAVLFAHFASEVLERETGGFDRSVRSVVAGHRSPPVLSIFQVVTQLGTWWMLTIASVVVAWVLVRRGARVRSLLVAFAPFLGSLAIYGMKGWFRVDRPNIGSALTFSFPSGHTSGATAVALVIGYVLRREKIGGQWSLPVAVAVAIMVGLSRIILDMHWASDVVGGWLIGGAYATAVCALYQLAWARRQRATGS